MGQQVRRRKQGNVQYQANNKESLSLSRGMIFRELYLKLTGNFTPVTAAGNTQLLTLQGDEWAVVKRIDLIANNTDVLRSISGNQLWWLNYFLFGVPPDVTPVLGDGVAVAVPFASHLILPLWMPRSLRPMDTALDARELSDLKLEITWGDEFDIQADAGGAFATEPVLEVHSLESFGAQGPFSQWRVYAIEKTITATAAQFQIQLPVGPMYRGFLMNFTDGGKDANDILNNFKIISGTTVFADVPALLLNELDRLRMSISRFWNDAAAAGLYDALRRGSTYNSVEGWYFYDHVTDGYLSESIDTLGFSEFELELDVTVGAGTTKVFILPLQIVPVRGK